MCEAENSSLHQLQLLGYKQTFANWRAMHNFRRQSSRLSMTSSRSPKEQTESDDLPRDQFMTHPKGQVMTKDSKVHSEGSQVDTMDGGWTEATIIQLLRQKQKRKTVFIIQMTYPLI